jgi:hypothetical protein
MVLKPSELGWCAGLFEGEGSIVCYKMPNRKNSYRVSLSISMIDKDVLETFVEYLDVGKVKGPYKTKNRKDRYTWEVQNFRDCLYVAKLLFPYLHERRAKKAVELINLCESRLIRKG